MHAATRERDRRGSGERERERERERPRSDLPSWCCFLRNLGSALRIRGFLRAKRHGDWSVAGTGKAGLGGPAGGTFGLLEGVPARISF